MSETLRIIPLGGLGEIGLNMLVVEYGSGKSRRSRSRPRCRPYSTTSMLSRSREPAQGNDPQRLAHAAPNVPSGVSARRRAHATGADTGASLGATDAGASITTSRAAMAARALARSVSRCSITYCRAGMGRQIDTRTSPPRRGIQLARGRMLAVPLIAIGTIVAPVSIANTNPPS